MDNILAGLSMAQLRVYMALCQAFASQKSSAYGSGIGRCEVGWVTYASHKVCLNFSGLKTLCSYLVEFLQTGNLLYFVHTPLLQQIACALFDKLVISQSLNSFSQDQQRCVRGVSCSSLALLVVRYPVQRPTLFHMFVGALRLSPHCYFPYVVPRSLIYAWYTSHHVRPPHTPPHLCCRLREPVDELVGTPQVSSFSCLSSPFAFSRLSNSAT